MWDLTVFISEQCRLFFFVLISGHYYAYTCIYTLLLQMNEVGQISLFWASVMN